MARMFNALSGCRAFLYALLFCCCGVLLGLTAWHVHYTESLAVGDVLGYRLGPFYVPTIVELLVTSALGIIFSLIFLGTIFARIGGGTVLFAFEIVALSSLWILFIVGAGIVSNRWYNLGWCRGSFLVCRIVSTIIAFSWINWAITTFLMMTSCADASTRDERRRPKNTPQPIQSQTGQMPSAVPASTSTV